MRLLLAYLVLLVHAGRTHGIPYALIWLGLTAAMAAAVSALLVSGLHGMWLIRFGTSADERSRAVLAAWRTGALCGGSVLYLGALLAKGFVERTRWRGAILPFVLVCGVTTFVVGLPFFTPPALFAAPIGLWFALAYRLVSRMTRNDWGKLALLTALLPLILICAYFTLQAIFWLGDLASHQ